MYKKLLIILILIFSSGLITTNVYSQTNAPTINCIGLPGCPDDKIANPTSPTISKMNFLYWISDIIGETIKYISVIAVLSLIISGIFYIISGGEEEKTKKAKKAIIWSLVGVFLSISAWGIINMLNAIKI